MSCQAAFPYDCVCEYSKYGRIDIDIKSTHKKYKNIICTHSL